MLQELIDAEQRAEETLTAIRKVLDLTSPSTPQNVSASAAGTNALIVWDEAVGARGVAAYRIYDNGTEIGSTDAGPFTIEGLSGGTHIFAVAAVDGRGTEGSKGTASTVFVSVVAPTPDSPVSFNAIVVSNSRIDLSWAAGSGGSAPTDYDMDFSTNNGSSWSPLTVGLQTTFSHTGLSAGTYDYRIKAKASGLESAYVFTEATITAVTSAATFGLGNDLVTTATWRTTADVVNGWDWSFAPGTAPATQSGMWQFGNNLNNWPTNFPGKKIYKIDLDWNECEAVRGVYTLGDLNALSTLSNSWAGVQLDVRGTVYESTGAARVTCPSWLSPTGKLTHSTSNHGGFKYFDVGEPAWYGPFRQLIERIAAYQPPAFQGTTYTVPNHPRLTFQLIHGMSPHLGEEGLLGANPSTGHVKTIRDWWIALWGSNFIKQAWCGEGRDQADNNQILALGIGSRGAGERWLRSEMTPRWTDSSGTTITDIGQRLEQYKNAAGTNQTNQFYLTVDETFGPYPTNSHHQTQVENYRASDLATKEWGVVPHKWHLCYRYGMLRHLQMRRNNFGIETPEAFKNNTGSGGVNGREGFINPEIIKWTAVNMGKRVDGVGGSTAVANEAFCALLRTYARGWNSNTTSGSMENITIHNLERWLTQREAWGGTTPAQETQWGWNIAQNAQITAAGLDKIDVARTMDSGTTGIGFKLDEDFLTGAHADGVAIKVTYVDNNTQSWNISYKNASNVTQTSSTITNTNTGVPDGAGTTSKVKTATFFLSNFANVAGSTTTFSIKGTTSSNTTPFMFVRVVLL